MCMGYIKRNGERCERKYDNHACKCVNHGATVKKTLGRRICRIIYCEKDCRPENCNCTNTN